MPIPYRIGTTILNEIERVYDDITNRAYQVGFHGSGAYTLNIEDWLTAERQMLRKPDADLIEKHGLFIVKLTLADVEPSAVDILVTTDDVLVQSNANSPQPRIFRTIHFPSPINPVGLYATCVNRKLILIAPKLVIRNAFEPVPA